MSHFVLADRKTDYLLPPSVDDWLTQDHLARFVVEVIDQLDLSNLTRKYAGRGSKAYHPATLLAIIVYGYATGVFSSRRLETATYDSVAFRYIAAGSHPDHDTLATFRRRFIDELAGLFVQVLEMATEMKLLKLGTVCLDGYPRFTLMPLATVHSHTATSSNWRSTSSAKFKSCWLWPNKPTRPTSPMD